MTNIFVIEQHDKGYGSNDYWSESVTLMAEHGYFTSHEAAQAAVTRLEDAQKADHARYVVETKKQNADRAVSYNLAMRKRRVLLDAGFDLGREPVKPYETGINDFEHWRSAKEIETYVITELEPGVLS